MFSSFSSFPLVFWPLSGLLTFSLLFHIPTFCHVVLLKFHLTFIFLFVFSLLWVTSQNRLCITGKGSKSHKCWALFSGFSVFRFFFFIFSHFSQFSKIIEIFQDFSRTLSCRLCFCRSSLVEPSFRLGPPLRLSSPFLSSLGRVAALQKVFFYVFFCNIFFFSFICISLLFLCINKLLVSLAIT